MFPNLTDYKILKTLPSGGWADVYLAKFKGKEVAVKILKEKLAKDPKRVEEFFLEAKSIQNIVHENIVKIVHIGPRNGPLYYFSMEYYSAGNLNNYLKEKKILPNKEIKILATEICRALNVIHRKEILHLDLKPSNILFGKNNLVVLADFGISRNLSTANSDDNLRGTPQYMSPEQFGGKVGFASDLYSLGVIMYYMASGMLPFDSENFNQIGLLHNLVPAIQVSEYNPTLHPGLDTIIMRLLEKKPSDRYQSAAEVLVQLKKIEFEENGIGGGQQNLVIEEINDQGAVLKKKIFKTFPVSINKYKDVKDNFCVLDPFASKEHAIITKPEPGKLLLTDTSKNGTKANGVNINDSSVALNETENKIEIGKTILRVYLNQNKKRKFNFSRFAAVIALVIVLSGALYALVAFLNRNPEGTFTISNLIGVPDTVFIDEKFEFEFERAEVGNAIPQKLIISPIDGDGEIFETSLNDKTYSYSSKQLGNDSSRRVNFSIRISNDDGVESNSISKPIVLMKPSGTIRIDRLQIPKEVRINTRFTFDFQISSTYSLEELEMNISDETGRTELRAIRSENKWWSFNREGRQKIALQISQRSGNRTSNILHLPVNVIPDFPPPIIRITSTPMVLSRRLSTSFEYSDARYSSPTDFEISLVYRSSGNTATTRLRLDAASRVCSHQFEVTGRVSWWIEIRTRDGRQGRTGAMEIEI